MKFRLEVHLVPEYIRNLVPVSRYHGNWLTVRGSLSCGRIGSPASLWNFGMTSEEKDRGGDRRKKRIWGKDRCTKRESKNSSAERCRKGWDVKSTSLWRIILRGYPKREMRCEKIEHLERNCNNQPVILDPVMPSLDRKRVFLGEELCARGSYIMRYRTTRPTKGRVNAIKPCRRCRRRAWSRITMRRRSRSCMGMSPRDVTVCKTIPHNNRHFLHR